MKRHVLSVVFVLVLAPVALAGTATMSFVSDAGLFTNQAGVGTLTSSGGRASFSGANLSFLEKDSALVSSGGTVSATMTLRPSTDAVNTVGIVMESGGDMLQALCDSSGLVTLIDYAENYRSYQFPYPAAYNNYFTLQYSASTGRATLTLNNSYSVFLEDALAGATSVHVGVTSGGAGGFVSFSATGTGIPTYPAPDPDSDGDGITDAAETLAGTDPNDPGNRPVGPSSQTVLITASNGVTLSFPPNSVTSTINVDVNTPASIPAGTVPDGKMLSQAGVEISPSSTTFSSPVTVSLPYTPAQVHGLAPVSLRAYVYEGGAYTSSGIVGGIGSSTKVTFTTTHFSLFVLAGDPVDSDGDGMADLNDAFPGNPNGQTDTDDDGIGDEWEMDWFGNLTTADEISDFDNDGVSDRREFEIYEFALDPTDGTTALPAAGALALGLSLAAMALRKIRRM